MRTEKCGVLSELAQAVITKYHRLGSLYTTTTYFSQCWRLEVSDRGASMVRSG